MAEVPPLVITRMFDPEIIDAFGIDDPILHDETLRQTMDVVRFESESGQGFSGLDLNRDAPIDNPIIVLLGQYLGRSGNPERKYEGYAHRALFPANRIAVVDLVGHGESDKATYKQLKEIIYTGGVSELAASMASAVMARMPDAENVLVVGDSFGGRLAPDFAIEAGKLGLEPVGLAGHEITGIDKRPVLGLMTAFFVQEWWAQRGYRSSREGHHLNVAYDKFVQELKADYGYKDEDYKLYDIYRNDPAFIYALMRNSPMATNDSFDRLDQLVQRHPDIQIAIASAGMSKVSRLQRILGPASDLARAHPSNIQWEIWPNDSHSMGLAPEQPRLAAHTYAHLGHLASVMY